MIKTFSLTAALALSFGFISPATPFAHETLSLPNADYGAVAITLTTDDGELTDVAQKGFDVPATTASSVRLSSILLAPIAPSQAYLASSSRINSEDLSNILTQEYELFSAPIAIEDPFAVAALTWQSDSPFPQDATIEMRTLDDGQWSPWYNLEVDDCPADVERCGSDYMVSGSSTGIQARISHTESSLPADLSIDISYSTSGEETTIDNPETTEILPSVTSLTQTEPPREIVLASSIHSIPEQANTASLGNSLGKADTNLYLPATQLDTAKKSLVSNKANIKPRSAWNDNESIRTWDPSYANFEGVIIHHTAGSNSYTQAQVPSVIRGIYRYHAITRGWGDIGYNVLIDKYGGRWEGRYGTLDSPARQMVIGGHAKPRNTGTMGISVMGDYTNIQPTNTVITALSEVSAWKFIDANINPTSTSPLTIPTETSTMKKQVGKPLNRIVGHKDVAATDCPMSLYNYLGQIRQNVQSLYQQHSVPDLIKEAQRRAAGSGLPMFRLYNTVSHEHLYTSDPNEVLVLTRGEDWLYEGVGWVAPQSSAQPVYRLYSPILHDHHYTADKNEIKVLTKKDHWIVEGICWYNSTSTTKVPVYRQFNPRLQIGSHHFTTDMHEYTVNNSYGWTGEGIAWYANKQGW